VTKTIRPFMNGESARMLPVSGLRRGAPGRSVKSANTASVARIAHVAYRKPRDSSADIPSSSLTAGGRSPVYSPSRGSTIFSVISETTTVSRITDATENQKLAVSSIDRDGSRM